MSYDAGREMPDPNCGIGDIPMLATGARGPVKFNLQIGFLYLYCHTSLMDRILLVDT
jgi:hypothetical protein